MRTITSEDDKLAKLQQFQADQIAKRDREALNKLLHSSDGRWFLMRLMDKTMVNANVFTGNSQTFFNEGKRSVGLVIMSEIAGLGMDGILLKQRAEKEYIKFQQENRLEYMRMMERGDE